MIGVGALALVLALLTFVQTGVWRSEEALWTNAARVAPWTPRPWIGLAWVSLREGRLEEAEHRLDQAAMVTGRQSARERDWARDSIDATRAQVWMRQGRLREAARLIAEAPKDSERWNLCQRSTSVCALASSLP